MQLELYVFTLAQEQLEWGGPEKETIPILIQDEIFLDYFFYVFYQKCFNILPMADKCLTV